MIPQYTEMIRPGRHHKQDLPSTTLGHISKPIAQHLIREGHQVTFVSSNPDRIEEIEILGATASIGSVKDAEFLSETLAGARVSISNISREYYIKHHGKHK